MRTSLLFVSLVAFAAAARPARACLSPEDLATMRTNQARAAAAGCADAIVQPGRGIGFVYLGQDARSAAKLARNGVTFESHSGKVTHVFRTGSSVCISTGFLAPLRVLDQSADLAAFPDCTKSANGRSAMCMTEGLALVREARGIRAEVTAGRTRRE